MFALLGRRENFEYSFELFGCRVVNVCVKYFGMRVHVYFSVADLQVESSVLRVQE